MASLKLYSGKIYKLSESQIFVFGSNPKGIHGLGSAKIAHNLFGAVYGKGRGISGQSYALPTKNLHPGYIEKSTGIKYERYGEKSLTKKQIIDNIVELYLYAIDNPSKDFLIAYQFENKSLNGYTSDEILDMFFAAAQNKYIPSNIIFSNTFKKLFPDKIKKYNVK